MEKKTFRILCACIGNKDRSPVVKAFLNQMLTNKDCAMDTFAIDSVGVNISARAGGSPSPLVVKAAKVFGLDLSEHKQRYAGDIDDVNYYQLAVVADFTTQVELVKLGFTGEIINLNLEGAANAWMSQNQRKVDDTVVTIMSAVAREVIQYKFAD